MIKELLLMLTFILLLFAVPLIPCGIIWWLLSPVGFFQIFITIIACAIIYIPTWFIWLFVLLAIAEA